MQFILPVLTILALDALLIALLGLALIPLAKYKQAAFAVLKRNFISYFSTPTGYVFLCLFVLLTSFAAFWPHEFFNSNMATLDQLNVFLPYIMLVFIPAITMGIWAEERRQGTDELLLTIPAGDFDIVLGKYLAAALIFTASLLFSQLSNFSMLNALSVGEADLGLFFATYIGYWMIGLAMLSLGMIASFLTSNLTVGFILGAVFNAPLAFASSADVIIPWTNIAQAVSRWSLISQFEDFGRGVISLSSISFFMMVVVVGLYTSVTLIGRRHWLGGRDGRSLLGHYIARTIALLVISASASLILANHDFRFDATEQQVSSLSEATKARIKELELERPIYIEAFISKTLPESFVKTKFDLISILRELDARGGGKIKVNIHDNMEPFNEEAKYAEERYNIRPTTIASQNRGVLKQEEIFLAAAFTCSLERVVVPFFGQGSPVEYELVRSLCTVADQSRGNQQGSELAYSRKTIGVLRTDAQMTGGMNFQTFRPTPPQAIIEELRKQYTVEDVDPGSPIELGKYDVLLVVQPSSLSPPQLDNLIAAIRGGQATAIFEDPFPANFPATPGTDMPKQPRGGGMMGRMPPEQKCDLKQLWQLLGISLVRAKEGTVQGSLLNSVATMVRWQPFTAIVYQHYLPYPKNQGISDAAIFASPDAFGAKDAYNPDQPAVSGFQEVVFLAPGAIQESNSKSADAQALEFIPLVQTGTDSGIMTSQQIMNAQSKALLKQVRSEAEDVPETEPADPATIGRMVVDSRLRTEQRYILAARIQGELSAPAETPDQGQDDEENDSSDEAPAPSTKNKIDVIVVSDIDVLHSMFLMIRNQPAGPVNYKFQNVEFVLNLIDVLAGDERFVDIRKRQTHHASLKLIEQRIQNAEEKSREKITQFENEINQSRQEGRTRRETLVAGIRTELNKLQEKGTLDSSAVREAQQKLDWQIARNDRESAAEEERTTRRLASDLRQIQRQLELDRLKIQNEYKFWAVTLPPIPPLFVALAVFARRRLREREGVAKSRLR